MIIHYIGIRTVHWPHICSIAGDVFVLQPDGAPTHRTHDTVEFLCYETPQSLMLICGWPAHLT